MKDNKTKVNDKKPTLKISPEEEARLIEITTLLNKLTVVCSQKPYASIICSISVPASDGDYTVASIYAGDTQSQVNQLHFLAKKNPEFTNDLQLYLAHKIKKQMEENKTSGNNLADQMMAQMNEDDKKTIIN